MTLSVAEAIASHACSTSLVHGLSLLIVREMLTADPGCLVPVVSPRIHAASHVHLFLQSDARDSLLHVLNEREGTLIANSMFRTLPEQAMVHSWAKTGRCGVTAAAPIGSSLHEQGLAIDVAAAPAWHAAFGKHGWRWLGPVLDPPHMEFVRDGVRPDIGRASVKAFQALWNRFHQAAEHLVVDGDYGVKTARALQAAPAGGWAE